MRREARGCDIGGSGRANAAILAEGRDWGLGKGDWGFGIGDWGFECGSGFSRELCLGTSPCEGRGWLGGGAHGSHRSGRHHAAKRLAHQHICRESVAPATTGTHKPLLITPARPRAGEKPRL